MSYRFMRVIILFDLPSITAYDRREYSKFHKYLIKNGFIMLQESVYSKLALNSTAAEVVMGNIRKNKPTEGLVQMLSITETQFLKMEFVVGESCSCVIDSQERLIIL